MFSYSLGIEVRTYFEDRQDTSKVNRHRQGMEVYDNAGRGREEILLFAFQMTKEVNEINAIQAVVFDTLNANAESF